MQTIETIPQKYIHNQFNQLIDTVKTQPLNQEQLINNIQLVEKSILSMNIKTYQTPLEEDLLQSWEDIKNGDIEVIDDDYINKLLAGDL
ncbi:MAG: hypothetical protein KGV51_03985 [Moraxellaceae bacterium]|nr:hypothetical protein [Moraxellaceae bacterium]